MPRRPRVVENGQQFGPSSKKTTSPIWNHFEFPMDPITEQWRKRVRCVECHRPFVYSGGTSTLKRHLEFEHQDRFRDVQGQECTTQGLNNFQSELVVEPIQEVTCHVWTCLTVSRTWLTYWPCVSWEIICRWQLLAIKVFKRGHTVWTLLIISLTGPRFVISFIEFVTRYVTNYDYYCLLSNIFRSPLMDGSQDQIYRFWWWRVTGSRLPGNPCRVHWQFNLSLIDIRRNILLKR